MIMFPSTAHRQKTAGAESGQGRSVVKRKLVVCDEREPRRVGDIEILPWRVFLDRLFAGDLTE